MSNINFTKITEKHCSSVKKLFLLNILYSLILKMKTIQTWYFERNENLKHVKCTRINGICCSKVKVQY